MNKKLWRLVQIFFGLVLFSFIYIKIGLQNIVKGLFAMNYLYLIPILFIFIISFIIGAFNLKILTDVVAKVKFSTMFRYHIHSWALGLLAPGKVGEVSLIFYLKRHSLTLGEGFAVFVLDKLITVFVLGIISVIGFFFLINKEHAALVAMVLFLILIILILLITRRKIRWFVQKYILRKYERKFNGFYRLLTKLILRKKIIGINVFLTVFKWASTSFIIYLFLISLNFRVDFVYVFMINAIIVIVSLIPISINGLGLREGSALYLFSLVGVTPEIIATTYIFINLMTYFAAGLSLMFIKTK
jgi:uncharacterized protein (TIRG00374 family)